MSWCRQDADLLLLCGKDNRALCWNPQTAEIIARTAIRCQLGVSSSTVPPKSGFVGYRLLRWYRRYSFSTTTNEAPETQAPVPTPKPDDSDVFDVPGFARTTQPTLSLKQPPKWLRRPISASFGYGGQFISVSNLLSAHGKTQSAVVHIRKVVTEPSTSTRAKELKAASDGQNLSEFAQKKLSDAETRTVHDSASWKALASFSMQTHAKNLLPCLVPPKLISLAG